MADLREAILQIARHFDAVDPKKVMINLFVKKNTLFCKKLYGKEYISERCTTVRTFLFPSTSALGFISW